MPGLIAQAQGAPQQGQQPMPPEQGQQAPQGQGALTPPQMLATTAAKMLYGSAEAAAGKIMADGKVDEDEAAEVVTNLMAGVSMQLKQQGAPMTPQVIVLSFPLVTMIVCEFCVVIGALTQDELPKFAQRVLPLALADFKARVLSGKQGQGDEAEPQDNPAEEMQEGMA